MPESLTATEQEALMPLHALARTKSVDENTLKNALDAAKHFVDFCRKTEATVKKYDSEISPSKENGPEAAPAPTPVSRA